MKNAVLYSGSPAARAGGDTGAPPWGMSESATYSARIPPNGMGLSHPPMPRPNARSAVIPSPAAVEKENSSQRESNLMSSRRSARRPMRKAIPPARAPPAKARARNASESGTMVISRMKN